MISTQDKRELLAIVKRFTTARLLVVGDVMADRYIFGDVERISPEAPVPVVRVRREDLLLGGAANVAANLRALGAQVRLCGAVGEDEPGRLVRAKLAERGIDDAGLVTVRERPTIVKARVVAHSQQVARIDWEDRDLLAPRQRRQLVAFLEAALPDLDGVIVSDYGKGAIGKGLLDTLRRLARRYDVPVAVDPKIRNMPFYGGFTVMTPNHHETGDALGRKLANTNAVIHDAGRRLRRKLRLESLVVTRGEEGMSLFFGEDEVLDIPTVARDVFDVTGAGDTVIASLACGLAVGASLRQAALIANFAAGLAIAEVGTVAVPAERIATAIRGARASR